MLLRLPAFGLRILTTMALVAAPVLTHADDGTGNDVWARAMQSATTGPADVTVAGQATLHLPPHRVYVPQPQATKLLQAMGNPGEDSTLQGLVFPDASEDDWFMTVRYEPSGYVRDDDARNWDVDELLESYREGTEASNEARVQMGGQPLEIIGWAQKPDYDAARHRLVWAMASREKGSSARPEEQGVNYNTYVLGREGYVSMNLVTGLKDLPTYRTQAHELLGNLDFAEGKRYADFNEETDHVAEYGLAALVLGVGAKKLGLLAVIGAFLLKFAKVILLGVVGLGAAAKKLFGRKAAG